MATKLNTNYKDDIINTNVNPHRRFRMTEVSGQTDVYEFEETTEFIQEGTNYGADDVNATNGTINDLIDEVDDNSDTLAGILNGTTAVGKARTADTATTATNATHATTADTATSATNATRSDTAGTATRATRVASATNATRAGRADTASNALHATTADTASTAETATVANQLATGRKINNVVFNGTQNITIYDDTKVPLDKDFILRDQQSLTFSNKVCRITDSRITSNSLADIYFTAQTLESAMQAQIELETYNGYLEIYATNTPSRTLVASIHVRVM